MPSSKDNPFHARKQEASIGQQPKSSKQEAREEDTALPRRWKNPYRTSSSQEVGGDDRRQPEDSSSPQEEPLPSQPNPSIPTGDALLRAPFSKGRREDGTVNSLRDDLSTTIRDLQFVDPAVIREVSPRVAGLSVKDLQDLAAEFAGVETYNPNVEKLTIEDIQDIEGVFFEFKSNTIARISQSELAEGVDVSCCCCTPCCCCAASDVDPF